MSSDYGLEWNTEGILGAEPVWTVEPSLEIVTSLAHQHLKLSNDDIARTSVEFKYGGAFNKLYAIECPQGSFFMRVSLPVDPHFKTLSETATIGFVESRTSIPVPRIITSNALADTELKFEWILMERVAGAPLENVWSSMTWDAKVTLVKNVARILAQMFELRFSRIGNLFRAADLSDTLKHPNKYNDTSPSITNLSDMSKHPNEHDDTGFNTPEFSNTSEHSNERDDTGSNTLEHPNQHDNTGLNTAELLDTSKHSNERDDTVINTVDLSDALEHPNEHDNTESSTAEFLDTSKHSNERDATGPNIVVDRIVSMMFFYNGRTKLDVPRGPFTSSRDWMDARLQLLERECKRCAESGEGDMEDIERLLRLIPRLRTQLPTIFPLEPSKPEEFALHHDDISRHNLIVDETGKLQGLVDWECVSVLPLWKGCATPTFLARKKRAEKLDPNNYNINAENTLYYEHLDEYECTLLRQILVDEMAQLSPEWKIEHDATRSKEDYDQAVNNCNDEFGVAVAENWVNYLEAGGEYLDISDAWDRHVYTRMKR